MSEMLEGVSSVSTVFTSELTRSVRGNPFSEGALLEFPEVDMGNALTPNAAAKYVGDDDKSLALASKHLEAMFVQQMFSAMRSTNKALASDSPLSSANGGVFEEFLDQQMVLGMSKTSSFGIAEAMYKQLK
ncbi:hypothetical protein F7U66_00740 [Vibrio parahaemolyticus]|nr:hypothetical protein [Vibrio parahaemolyticus]